MRPIWLWILHLWDWLIEISPNKVDLNFAHRESIPSLPPQQRHYIEFQAQKKGKQPGSEYRQNSGLSLPACNYLPLSLLLLNLPLSLSLLNPLLLYLSSREHASWISGNITFLSTPPPSRGRGPTTEHVYLAWLAVRDCLNYTLISGDFRLLINFLYLLAPVA